MSSLVTTEGIVHYEQTGRGKPVVLLHGWLNSWDVWRSIMLALSERHQFRVYALDFWGWGESDKRPHQKFNLSSYASMVMQFMDAMGIDRVPIIGHSMGGTVALTAALDYPERTGQVAVVGSPIVGNSLNLLLNLAAKETVAKLAWRIPHILDAITWWVLAGEGTDTYHMIRRDVSRTTMEAFFHSINDLSRVDLRPRLPEIRIPVLAIFGERDNIVHPNQAEVIAQLVPQSKVEIFPNSRHFPMRDQPEKFLQVLVEFLTHAQNHSS